MSESDHLGLIVEHNPLPVEQHPVVKAAVPQGYKGVLEQRLTLTADIRDLLASAASFSSAAVLAQLAQLLVLAENDVEETQNALDPAKRI